MDWRHARFSSVFLAVATIPASAWAVGFWLLVLRARIASGSWPRPSHGSLFSYEHATMDPGAFGMHTDLLWLGLMFLSYAIPLAALCGLVSAPFRIHRPDHRLVFAFLASAAVVALTVLGDPGGCFLWFLD